MSSPTDRVDVLGVQISAIDLFSAVATIGEWIERGSREYVCVTTVNNVVACQDDPELLQIHNDAGMTTPDGMPLVWSCHWAGARNVRRVYGPDLLLAMAEEAARTGFRFYFFGGGPGVPEALAGAMTERFPGLVVCGTHSPPFRALDAEETAATCAMINAAAPDIVWVGLGNPKQERWMAEHRAALDAPVLIGVGAAFDFFTGRARQAPRWMQRSGLEWLFRLVHEPRRLWRRYLINNPRFVFGILRRPPRRLGDHSRGPGLLERVRWRATRLANRVGLDPVSTVRDGPGAGLRVGSMNASGDYRSGRNERPVQDAVTAELTEGDVFLDIGANVGFFALLASRRVGPAGRVVAFEPMPDNVASLRKNLARNEASNVTVIEAAVGATARRGRLGLSTHPGGHALEETGAPHDLTGFVDVPIVTIDDLVASGEVPPPDFAKIDTESGELEVLHGMRNVLEQHRPALLIELDAAANAEVEAKAEPIEALLTELGYRIERLRPSYPNRSWYVTHLMAHFDDGH